MPDGNPLVQPAGMPSVLELNELELRRDPIIRIEDGSVVWWWHDTDYRCNIYVRDQPGEHGADPQREIVIYGRRKMPPVIVGQVMAEVFMPDDSTIGEYFEVHKDRPPAIIIRKLNGMPTRQGVG